MLSWHFGRYLLSFSNHRSTEITDEKDQLRPIYSFAHAAVLFLLYSQICWPVLFQITYLTGGPCHSHLDTLPPWGPLSWYASSWVISYVSTWESCQRKYHISAKKDLVALFFHWIFFPPVPTQLLLFAFCRKQHLSCIMVALQLNMDPTMSEMRHNP